ncbi:MAG: hypothetical protein IT480_00210 [Gammaproteobacteria bacterium]|nr:hypothetical protein [Gammaproteobacteria bacterium]
MIPRLHRWSIAALFQFRSRVKREPVIRHHVQNPYHAVAIHCGRGRACRTARRLEGQRFLAREAPRLPLPDCDSATCSCRYRHYEDRRMDVRRASDEHRVEHPYAGVERRQHRGRRCND